MEKGFGICTENLRSLLNRLKLRAQAGNHVFISVFVFQDEAINFPAGVWSRAERLSGSGINVSTSFKRSLY